VSTFFILITLSLVEFAVRPLSLFAKSFFSGSMSSPQKNGVAPARDSPLDHDFHSAWGSVYTNRSTVGDKEILPLWQQYAVDKAAVERKYQLLLNDYTDLFTKVFGYYPISMHAHATDSLMPTTIASLILNTAATSPLVLDSETLRPKADEKPEETGMRVRDFALSFLGWTETHILAPNYVVADNVYGAGYGPLVRLTPHSGSVIGPTNRCV
jgi:hypothetical protein